MYHVLQPLTLLRSLWRWGSELMCCHRFRLLPWWVRPLKSVFIFLHYRRTLRENIRVPFTWRIINVHWLVRSFCSTIQLSVVLKLLLCLDVSDEFLDLDMKPSLSLEALSEVLEVSLSELSKFASLPLLLGILYRPAVTNRSVMMTCPMCMYTCTCAHTHDMHAHTQDYTHNPLWMKN